MTVMARPLPIRLPGSVAPRSPVPTNATVVGRCDFTESLASFTIALDSPLAPFQPGQYVSVGVADDGILVQRPYSVVSLTDGGRRVQLLVKRLSTGSFSPLLWRLTLGARVKVGPARGLFTLGPADLPGRVFVATGTGIAPFMAMLDELATSSDGVEAATLIHAVSFADELAFDDRLRTWRSEGKTLDYRPTVSRPTDPRNAGWPGAIGRAETQLEAVLSEPGFDAAQAVFYLCGNPDMIETCSALLARASVPPDHVHCEHFHPPRKGLA